MGQELIAKLEQIKPEQPLGRYEHKFRLSQSDYLSVRAALFAFCELDPNCKKTSGSYYTVRSEYFDTADFEGYVGKVQGEYNRNKFRIRCYSANPNENTPFKIEQKHRIGSLIYKSADNVNLGEVLAIKNGQILPSDGRITLASFLYWQHVKNLVPSTIVQYKREAFYSLTYGDYRFSFDHDIKYSNANPMEASAGCTFVSDYEGYVIFEIKTLLNDDNWIRKFVRDFSLKSEPNSKYANSVEHVIDDFFLR